MSESFIESSVNKNSDFDELNDLQVAHSQIKNDLFFANEAGEQKVNERINTIENEAIKNDALFNIAKLYFEKNNIEGALKKVDEITDLNERARCLVQLAILILNRENNVKLADEIVDRISSDNQGYLNLYKREKQKILES